MIRRLLALALTLLLLAAPAAAHPPPTTWRPDDPIQWTHSELVSTVADGLTDYGWTCYRTGVRDGETSARRLADCWRPLALLATTAWPVHGGADAVVRVVACESAGDPHAVGSVGEIGLAQHHPYFLSGRLHRIGLPDDHALAREPWTNLLLTAELAHRSGWTPWTCRP